MARATRRLPASGVISEPCVAARLARALIGEEAREHMLALYVSAAHCPFGYDIYTTGGRSAVFVDAHAIVKNAIVAGAVGFVTAHNHPSGRPEPSEADRQLFAELDKISACIGVSHLDDLVVGDGEFWSRHAGRAASYDTCDAAALGGYGEPRRRSRGRR